MSLQSYKNTSNNQESEPYICFTDWGQVELTYCMYENIIPYKLIKAVSNTNLSPR